MQGRLWNQWWLFSSPALRRPQIGQMSEVNSKIKVWENEEKTNPRENIEGYPRQNNKKYKVEEK